MTKPLFDVFRMAMLQRPDGSRAEAFDAFFETIKSDPAYTEALARDYFDRHSATWKIDRGEGTYLFRRTEPGENRLRRDASVEIKEPTAQPSAADIERLRADRERSRKRSAAALESLRASIRDVILLDLTLPNGKALRDSTGAECKRAGGFFREVAKHIRPTQVVDKHMSEADLQNIRARFYQRNNEREAAR